MLETLERLDKDLFLFLNDIHNSVADFLMFYITDTEFWFPFYGILLIVMFWKLKWDALPIVIGIIATLVISDQVTSGFMKPFFERFRPCHDPGIKHLVHLVDDCGAPYGFASGHASNSFGLATFLWLTLRDKWAPVVWMFAWAVLVSYSRIYVGVHYPADVIVGALVGVLAAYIIYKLYEWILPKIKKTKA